MQKLMEIYDVTKLVAADLIGEKDRTNRYDGFYREK